MLDYMPPCQPSNQLLLPVKSCYPAAAAAAAAGPDMSAPGMLAAINNARRTALPATATSPGAADWELQEAAVPLAVTAVRAAALSGDREAVVASLQQQLAPMKPTPLTAAQVGSTSRRRKLQECCTVAVC
jgi:hypothetical protein